jgi:hypothetical protein|tara:strand:+ start:348 stop:644 length:297 start_codon:yes stop_codon:yes gene_type:complete
MTYLYYKTSSTYASNQRPSPASIKEWEHLASKTNWRITQLANGFYQTECSDPSKEDDWHAVTRRETVEGAETAINGSIEHFSKKLDSTKGPKIVKTFK